MFNVDTKKLNTMKIGGKVSYISKIKSKKEIVEFFNNYKKYADEFFVLGDGSNTIFGDKIKNLAICKIEIKGKKIIKEDKDSVILQSGAGESWQKIIDFAVSKNWSGIEALTGIPGSVGAGPVQNIGAYGSEIRDCLIEVEVYDTKTKKFITLQNKDCDFAYRHSIFKKHPRRWVIISVNLILYKNKKIQIPNYKDVKDYFKNIDSRNIKLKDIKIAIEKIRERKLPNPKTIPNSGSFFKNPIINNALANNLKNKFPDLSIYKEKNKSKIPAGFLIEKAGFKGKRIGNIEIYKNNALVITNPNSKATFDEIIKVKKIIQNKVYKIFKIKLEPEVNIVT